MNKNSNFCKRSILITGGTGTFGKAFIEHIVDNKLYTRVVIFSRDEYKQFNLKNKLNTKYGQDFVKTTFRFFLGDIRDKERLSKALKGVDDVIHAAALKHVPFCEYNPDEALKTNVIGTKNVCEVAIEERVKNIVFLSTDKAVEPINFYGSTKMLAEKYSIYSNNYSENNPDNLSKVTKISCVRYGNIIGSRGSIVEVFKSMKDNDYFTITDESMTRFWMDINDCVEMVSWTLNNMRGGEIIIPKIQASRVLDVAKAVDDKKDIKITGIRPGEKIHEQLLNRREAERTYDVDDYFVVLPEAIEWDTSLKLYYDKYDKINKLTYASNDDDIQMSFGTICQIVSNKKES
jgi:UDP-N-acetylglucosamine 4,6-dehydratase/5-epimerase